MLTFKTKLLLALSQLKGVGRQKIRSIFRVSGLIDQPDEGRLAKVLSSNNLLLVHAFLSGQGRLMSQINQLEIYLETNGIQVINYLDSLYPPNLLEIDDNPLFLFVKGNPEVLAMPQIAIVGSRQASTSGLRHAYRFAQQLTNKGLAIVSGLAQGIDSAAHKAAVDSKGRTIAVMGAGLDQIYPAQHHRLALSILESGCWVSEYFPGVKPIAANFPRRNRIISGLSLGVLVVEARLKSGTLITARMALEQNREVFAIPGSIDYAGSKGCHTLIAEGAKLVQVVDDIIDELQLPTAFESNQLIEESSVSKASIVHPELSEILIHIEHSPVGLDELVLKSGLSANSLTAKLIELELSGLVILTNQGYQKL
jgi:DNA processing protein